MAVRIGINGFGNIGRRTFRQALRRKDVEIVAINDLADVTTSAHLLQYDSNFGRLDAEVAVTDGTLVVDGVAVPFFSTPEPGEIPWREAGAAVVLEATGAFRDGKAAGVHLEAGAERVIISAPGRDVDLTVVMGVNEAAFDPASHRVISNASCTTNCLAPVAKVLHDAFGVRRGLMTTVHAYTATQNTLDGPHKDLRRARGAAQNIIPTTTGAAVAVGEVLPELDGRLDGMAFRVPVAAVSVIDLVAELERTAGADQINDAFREAARELPGILAVSDEPLVSSDFIGDTHSATLDAGSTLSVGGNLAKVVAWYDNEWAYAARLLDLAARVGG